MSQYDTGPNVAPEHGQTPWGATKTNPDFGAAGGSRPDAPADTIGTVEPQGSATGLAPLSDPNDPDRDMDTEGPGDIDG